MSVCPVAPPDPGLVAEEVQERGDCNNSRIDGQSAEHHRREQGQTYRAGPLGWINHDSVEAAYRSGSCGGVYGSRDGTAQVEAEHGDQKRC